MRGEGNVGGNFSGKFPLKPLQPFLILVHIVYVRCIFYIILFVRRQTKYNNFAL